MYLDERSITIKHIGYGEVGTRGQLGYGGMWVKVCGKHYSRNVSAHPPSHLEVGIGGAEHFSCNVALNDSSGPDISANFLVYADGVLMAVVEEVKVFEPPRPISINIYGAKKLELVCETTNASMCHAVWLDLILSNSPATRYIAPFGDATICMPQQLETCEKCIVTMVTPNMILNAEDMLGSLYINGGCRDAHVVILAPDNTPEIQSLANKYNAQIVPCDIRDRSTLAMKAVVYSLAQVVCADQYLFLDADTMILGDLSPIFSSVSTLDPRSFFVCMEQDLEPAMNIRRVFGEDIRPYYANPEDINLFNISPEVGNSTFIVNTGVMAGSRRAFLGLESRIRTLMPNASIWDHSKKPDLVWREQAIANLAIM